MKNSTKVGVLIVLAPLVITTLVWVLTLGGFDLISYLHSELALGLQLMAIIIAFMMKAALSQED